MDILNLPKFRVKYVSILFVLILQLPLAIAQIGPFSPAAHLPGSTAIHKDDNRIVAWAKGIQITRGAQQLGVLPMIPASAGEPLMALGKAGTKGTVSLGDAGVALIYFEGEIVNGSGPDFVIFENGFRIGESQLYFLELAFVEVSSNGEDFFRFPCVSLIQNLQQINAFEGIDPTEIDGFAGKYESGFGTPFDLDSLEDNPLLDKNAIQVIKLIDVVGSINPGLGSRDSFGRLINDPFPTPFPSGGFDLDAVGAIHFKPHPTSVSSYIVNDIQVFPNPVISRFQIFHSFFERQNEYALFNALGTKIQDIYCTEPNCMVEMEHLPSGVYFLKQLDSKHTWTISKH
jgi:hypothetical protein